MLQKAAEQQRSREVELSSGRAYTWVMSHTISAVYADGVFRPLEPVDWPEGTRAEVIALQESASRESETRTAWPASYFEQTAGALAGEEFERPSQGELPRREEW